MRYWKWSVAVLASIWAVLIGTTLGYAWNTGHQDEKKTEVVEKSTRAMPSVNRYWTIAIFGVDSREGNLGKETRSDMEMVCNINLGTGEIRLVSVYRDTLAKMDEKNGYDKINQAYFIGGPVKAVEVLSENLDLDVDDHASFSWKAVVEAINLLGGIDVEISWEEFKLINGFITETVESTGIGSHHLKKEGLNHLDGVQAVAYARLRKMDTDFMRTKRQRQVMELLLEKLKNADRSTLKQIAGTVLPQISTSIGLKDLLPIASKVKDFHMTQTAGFPFELKDAMIGKKDCVIPVTLEENVRKLHKFLFNEIDYQPSKQVKEISRHIEEMATPTFSVLLPEQVFPCCTKCAILCR